MVELSAVIVNYNGGEIVHRCIDSLLRYIPEGGIEIIVVDNASSDGSPATLVARDDIIFIESKRNLGFAGGCNIGLERATGDFLALVNPDLEIHDDVLGSLMQFVKDTANGGIAAPTQVYPDGTHIFAHRRLPSLPLMLGSRKSPVTILFPNNPITRKFLYLDLDPEIAHEVEMVTGTLMVFNREVYEAIGGLDDGYFMYVEDADFCLRAKKAGFGIYYLPYLSVQHYVGYSTSRRPFKMILTHHRSLLRFFRLHRPLHFISYLMLSPFALAYILVELAVAAIKLSRD